MQYGEAAGIEINFAVFMAVGAIITFGTITLYTLAMKYVFRADFSKLRDFDPQSLKSEYAHMNKRQTIVLIVNAVVIGVILLASVVPSSLFIYEFFNNTLSTAGIYGIGAIALCLIPLNKKRQPLIEFFDVAAFSMSWEVILMVGATMAVASAVISEQSGLLAFASTALGPPVCRQRPHRRPADCHPAGRAVDQHRQQYRFWRAADPDGHAFFGADRSQSRRCWYRADLHCQHGSDSPRRFCSRSDHPFQY